MGAPGKLANGHPPTVKTTDTRRVVHHGNQIEDANKEADSGLDAKARKRDKKVEAITERAAAGKQLTKSQQKDLDNSPAVRVLVRTKLKQMDLDPATMYAGLLRDAYQASRGKLPSGEVPDEKFTKREEFDNRTLAMKHLQELEGLKAHPEREDALPPNIHIHAHQGLAMSISTDGSSNKIRTTPKAADAPLYERAGAFPVRDRGSSVGEEPRRSGGCSGDESGVRVSGERGSDNGAYLLDDREDCTPDDEAVVAKGTDREGL